MRDILGIEPTVLCSNGINKAYVVAPEDLNHFFEFGKRWIKTSEPRDSVIRCKYMLRGEKEAHIDDGIKSVLGYSNPTKMAIYHISMLMGCKSQERTFELTFQSDENPNLIQVYIGGPSLEETQSTFNMLSVELEELTRWYWPIACRRWLRRILTWVLYIFLVLFFLFNVLVSIGTAYHNRQIRKQYEQAVKAQPSIAQQEKKKDVESPDALSRDNSVSKSSKVNAAREIWNFIANKYFLGALLLIIGGWLTVLLVNYLFPKAIFEIGKGKNRHEWLKSVRKWVGGIIVMILLSGIVIPFLTRLVLGE